MQIFMTLIYGTIWHELRTRMFIVALVIIAMTGVMLKDGIMRYARESVATATVIAIEWKCAVVDKSTGRVGAPQVSQIPCEGLGSNLDKALPNRVVAQNRRTLARLAVVTDQGETIEQSVSFQSVGLARDAKVGDQVLVAYDPARPAEKLRQPVNLFNQLLGAACLLLALYFAGKGQLSAYTRRPQSTSDAGAGAIQQLLQELRKALGPDRQHDKGTSPGHHSIGDQLAPLVQILRKRLEGAQDYRKTRHEMQSSGANLAAPRAAKSASPASRAPASSGGPAAPRETRTAAGRPVQTPNYTRKPAVQRSSCWF